MSTSSPTLARRADLLRIALAIASFTAAVAWPLLNIGSRNTIVALWGTHGIDDGDIFAVVPFVIGLAVLALPWRRRMPVSVTLGALAIGVVLGGALGVLVKLARA